MPPKQDDKARPQPVKLPVEVEIYIEADGSVTFADLAAEVAPIAAELNPEDPLACDVPEQTTVEEGDSDVS